MVVMAIVTMTIGTRHQHQAGVSPSSPPRGQGPPSPSWVPGPGWLVLSVSLLECREQHTVLLASGLLGSCYALLSSQPCQITSSLVTVVIGESWWSTAQQPSDDHSPGGQQPSDDHSSQPPPNMAAVNEASHSCWVSCSSVPKQLSWVSFSVEEV
ncbi:hypothetical protein AAFF_G00271120 [Aldrovandia affinis]|uniref:Uncharacterized protein n=1 Tax=Aldrovandia affinis TaxID=143900 RepID=A0AAD7RBH9_9TELE|nr:hypothetical protein AAFF_G00271120 [Aldrovandia affinis]